MTLPSFDRPFGAGSAAEFYPGSLAIDFGLSRSAIADMNAGEAMANALRESQLSDSRGHTFRALPRATKQFFAVRAHEQDHLRRMLSTTFGFLGDSLRCLWLSLVARGIQESDGRGAKSLLASLQLPIRGEAGFEDSLTNARELSQQGSHTLSLVYGLADLLEALTDNVSPARFASALWALSNGNHGHCELLCSRIDVHKPVCSAHPIVNRDGIRQGLSARHLLELFAVGQHANGFLMEGGDLHDVVQLIGQSQREYVLAILAWNSVFGVFDPGDIESHPRQDADSIIEWYRMFPFELFIAADLALWPPFFPNDDLSIDGVLNWTDLDPGRRFVRILAAMVNRKITPSIIPADRRNERFVELQSDICHDFGWPTPHDLAAQWLEHLSHHLEIDTTPWHAMDGPSRYRIENAIKLLSIRLKTPADVILNNVNFANHGIEGSPVWLIREESDLRSAVAMGKGNSKLLVPLIMMEGSRHLFSRDRLLLSPLYGKRFREEAVDLLGKQLASLGEWSTALLGRFLDESHHEFKTKP
ncbi:MAG: hypothetical protein U0798_06870 [Gemmataceae bacterium]